MSHATGLYRIEGIPVSEMPAAITKRTTHTIVFELSDSIWRAGLSSFYLRHA